PPDAAAGRPARRRAGGSGDGSLAAGPPLTPASIHGMANCTHLDAVEILELPDPVEGCEECLASGMRWVHLRMCQTCGHVGCCDNSVGKHATAHHAESGHPIIRSA